MELTYNRIIMQLTNSIPELIILEQNTQVKTTFGIADLVLKITIRNVEKTIICEFKSSGEPRYVHQGVTQVKLISSFFDNSYPVLIVPKIGEKSKKICQLSDVGYLDLEGNCFLKFDTIYILIRVGSKNLSSSFTIKKPKKRTPSGLYAPKSSRIIRLLLNNRKSWTLKQLSKTAEVSIGLAYKVVKNLEVQGYVIRDSQYRLKVNRPETLVDDWAIQYNYSKVNTLHSFYTFERNIEAFNRRIASVANANQLKYALTLHAGAFMVAPYTRFTDIHCYIDSKDIPIWIDVLNLKPVESGGGIFLVEPYDEGVFHGSQKKDDLIIVSNIQLYIDLYNYPARGREQAEFLKNSGILFR